MASVRDVKPKSISEFMPRRLPDCTDSDTWPGIMPGRWVLASCQEYQDLISGHGLDVWSSLTDPSGQYGIPQVYTLWGTPDGARPVAASLALYDRRDPHTVIRCIHAWYAPATVAASLPGRDETED